jgi:hypothetical protein
LKTLKELSEAVNKKGQIIQWPKEKRQNYKTLHIKVKIEQHNPTTKSGVNSCFPEGYAFPVPRVPPFVSLLFQAR